MLTDEHEHAMKVWWEACAAYEDGAATDTSQPVRGMAIVGDQAAAAAVIAADRAGLVAEIERLRAMIEKLAGYAGHDDDCQIVTHGVWSDPIPCTCGYSEIARAALKDTRHEHG